MKLSEVRKEAMGALSGKWRKVFAITLIYLVVTYGISYIFGLFDEGSVVETVLVVLEMVITIPLSFGLAWTFLKLKRNETVKIIDLLKIGISKFFRAWKITGRILLKMIFPMCVFLIGILLYDIIVSYSIVKAQEGELVIARWGILGALVIYYLPFAYAMFVLLKYALTSFIAYDKPEMKAGDVVKESGKMMKRNRLKMIWLQMPYVLLSILGLFSITGEISYIGIIIYILGYMVIFPYIQVAMVCFYEKLTLQD